MEGKTLITSLPPEVIGVLSSFLSWMDICHLMMVGNRNLAHLLGRRSAVTSLEVNIPTNGNLRFAKWPTVFNTLGSLLNLSIRWKSDKLVGFDARNLPSSITSLKLKGKLSDTYNCSKLRSIFPNLLDLGIHEDLSVANTDWMATLPDTLTSLDITGYHDLIVLPSSLTALDISGAFNLNYSVALPRSIVKMSIQSKEFMDWDLFISYLPPFLEDLSMSSLNGDNFRLSTISSLPKTLKALNISGISLPLEMSSLLFPPGLVSFSPSCIDHVNQVIALPAGIAELDIDFASLTDFEEENRFFSAIPLQIRSLLIHNIEVASENPNFSWKTDLPSTLSTLRVPSWDFEGPYLQCIPSSITSLSIGLVKLTEDSNCSWPKLRVFSATTDEGFWVELVCFIARVSPLLEGFLTQYSFPEELVEGEWIPEEEKRTQFLDQWNRVTHIGVGTFESLSTENNSIFGNTLKHFEVKDEPYMGDEVILALPPSLNCLDLSSAQFVTDASIKRHLSSFSQLTVLKLPKAQLTGKCFKFLPRSLVTLNLNGSSEVSDIHILDLPRNISSVSLDNAIALTDACSQFIPPNIANFSAASNANLTVGILNSLRTIIKTPKDSWEFFALHFSILRGSIFSKR